MQHYLPQLSEPAIRWLRFLGLLIAAAFLLWLMVRLQAVLMPLVLALVVAYILDPLVTQAERRGTPRLNAVIILYAVGSILALTLGFFLVLKTIEQAVELRENAGEYARLIKEMVATAYVSTTLGGAEVAATQPAAAVAEPEASEWWRELGPLLQEHGLGIANSALAFVTGFFTSAFNWITFFVLLPLYAFFFLWHFPHMLKAARDHLPAAWRPTILYVVATANDSISNFFRGRLIVCLIIGLFTGIGWTLIGVPYGLPLGALAGLLNLVPFMSLLALPPALLFGYLNAMRVGENWVWLLLLTFGVYMLAQALESFILTPTIESKSSGLHPVVTVVVLLIGAEWAGLLGLLLAIPVTSTLKVLASTYLMPEIRRLANEPRGRPPDTPIAAVAATPAARGAVRPEAAVEVAPSTAAAAPAVTEAEIAVASSARPTQSEAEVVVAGSARPTQSEASETTKGPAPHRPSAEAPKKATEQTKTATTETARTETSGTEATTETAKRKAAKPEARSAERSKSEPRR